MIHIAGQPYTGFDAFKNLSQRICQHTTAAGCGCDEALIQRRGVAANALQ